MDKKMKNHYQVPSIKVVSFKVEEGFQSPLKVGDSPTAGIEAFNNDESWAARPYTPVQL